MTHRTQITASIKKYMDKARELYPNASLPDPTISFNMKGATVLGQARYGARLFQIRINDLVAKKYLDDAINDTAPHEVAHLVAYKVHGRCQGHGPNWQRIMRQFGIAPNRCASKSIDTLEFKQFKAKTEHVYNCGKATCEHTLGAGRHRKIQLGAAYTCRKTGGKLTPDTFVKTVRKTATQRKAEAYAKAGKALPGAPRAATAATAPKAPTKRRPTSSSPSKVSKKDRAEALYRGAKGQARPDIIALFMSQLDMTAAGAATYYANCKRTFG